MENLRYQALQEHLTIKNSLEDLINRLHNRMDDGEIEILIEFIKLHDSIADSIKNEIRGTTKTLFNHNEEHSYTAI